ncbi:F-box protein CPR1-like [Mercurialis annua]|uniref:F-box protein CPR1-like n=1 Tax=Mercurialis annua TaxID=3986 RepID=UPI0024AE1CB2|nr:F-box protein CPR1-like [Mercurialis annua]
MTNNRRRSSSPANQERTPFTQEMITGVFLQLPVKSLKRFKSLSKSCYSIINSQDFINAHLKNSANQLLVRRFHYPTGSYFSLSLMDYSDTEPAIFREIPIPFLHSLERYPRIVGSVNGLLCLDISPIHGSEFILWNISTEQYVILPRPEFKIDDFKNPIWMAATGFGYNQESDDYKLVRIVLFDCDHKPIRAEVYSWRTNSWRILDFDEKIVDFSISEGETAVHLNDGCLYWLANGIGDSVDRKYIISFDLGSETFNRINIPENSGAFCAKVLEFRNSLALVFYPAAYVHPGYGSSANEIELWVDSDYGDADDTNRYKQWVRVFRVTMDLSSAEMGCPICVHNDDEEVVVFHRVSADSVNLAFLNPDKETIKTVPICHSDYTCHFYSYVASLVPVAVYGVQAEADHEQ